jgi:hypothetical protein
MDEKLYLEFFDAICTLDIKIQVIETAIIQKGVVEALIRNDHLGYIKKTAVHGAFSIHLYFKKLLEEKKNQNKGSKLINNQACYIYKKNTRKIYDKLKIKKILARQKLNKRISLIQKYIPNAYDDKLITAKVVYTNNEYIPDISLGGIKINDPELVNCIIVHIKTIISGLQTIEVKRVVSIELEFLKDNHGDLWLVYCNNYTLSDFQYAIPRGLKSDERNLIKTSSNKIRQNSLVLKKIQNDFNHRISKKRKILNNHKYTFENGKIVDNYCHRDFTKNLCLDTFNSPLSNKSPSFDGIDKTAKISKLNNNKSASMLSSETLSSQSPKLDLPQLYSSFSDITIKKSLGPILSPSSVIISPRNPDFDEYKSPSKRIPHRKSNKDRIKTLPVISKKIEKDPLYDDNFIELVLKTYCKDPKLEPKYSKKEFGIGSILSSEEFSNLISKLDLKESFRPKNSKPSKLIVKPILEESYSSMTSTPSHIIKSVKNRISAIDCKTPRSSNISDIISNIKKRNSKSIERLNVFMNSPRCRKSIAN